MKEVPSSSISAANTEIAAVLQPSATGTKAVRGMYLKISAEKKAEIGQRAAEHRVLATVGTTLQSFRLLPVYTPGLPETH